MINETKETPTLEVTMPDGSVWRVPVTIIARDRASYYAKLDADRGQGDYEKLYQQEYTYSYNDDMELLDWAANNMNWSDVRQHAYRVEAESAVDYQEGWMNGERRIVR